MKLTFNGSLAIIRPSGFMDADATGLNFTSVQRRLIVAKNVSCVLLSLKYVAFFSPLWLGVMMTKVGELARETGASAAICDYNDSLYNLIVKSSAKFANFSLFESEQIAQLFFSDSIVDAGGKILIFNENSEYRAFAAQKLAERGYEVLSVATQKEFSELKPKHKFTLTSKTKVVFSTKFMHTFIKDGVVIYRVNGIMDSEFTESFDAEAHARLLKTGFKFFAFWVNITSGLNIHGANFLIKLAAQSSKYGALLSLCGLNPASLSADLVASLRASGVLLYKSLQDFYDDDSTIYVKKRPLEIEPRHITKNIVEILPSLITGAIETLSPLAQREILVATSVQTYEYNEECISGCVMFYGEFEMRFVLALKSKKVENLARIFGIRDDDLAGFSEIFGLLVNKILEIFIARGLNVNLAPSKICRQSFFDQASKGALVRLSVAGSELGVIFITK